MKKDLVEQISRRFSVPPESLCSLPLVHMQGSYAVTIENHHGIIAYAEDNVCIKTKNGYIRVTGEGICIHCMTGKTLELRGRIRKVELE